MLLLWLPTNLCVVVQVTGVDLAALRALAEQDYLNLTEMRTVVDALPALVEAVEAAQKVREAEKDGDRRSAAYARSDLDAALAPLRQEQA